MRHDQIALQMYTVRSLAAANLQGTLQAVADAGYPAVELAGLPDTPPRELAAMLDAAGLRVVASHEGIERLRADVNAVADRLTAVGCPLAIVPWMPEEDRRDMDHVRRFAEELNRYATAMRRHGMRLGYHNHDFEFAPLDGTTAWDVLLQELSPDVELELDVYWASVGGRDPVAEIRAHGDRIRLLHMKDRARDLAAGEPRDAPVGDGLLPMTELIDVARSADVAWYVVEQDVPSDPLRDIGRSHEYLSAIAR